MVMIVKWGLEANRGVSCVRIIFEQLWEALRTNKSSLTPFWSLSVILSETGRLFVNFAKLLFWTHLIEIIIQENFFIQLESI